MAFTTRNQVLLVKVESTYGTDPTPTGASDAMLVIDPVISPASEQLTNDTVTDTIGKLGATTGKRWVDVSFSTYIQGSGAAGTAPKGLGAALQACGFGETVGAGVYVTYGLVSAEASLKSVTIYAFLGGRRHIITGCIGNAEFVMEAGQFGRINFTFQGVYATPTTQSAASPTYITTSPPVVLSSSFEYGSVTDLVAQQVQLALNNEIAVRDSVNAASGIQGFQLVDRDVSGSFNPEQVALSSYDPFTDWAAGTQRALTITVGATAGNICTITADQCVYRTVNTGDRNGLLIYEHEIQCAKSSAGNDEMQLVFS